MSWSRKNSGVKLDNYLIEKIDLYADSLPFDIVITDGIRTARQQAQRMFAKLDKTPPEDLTTIYRNKQFANDIMDVYPDLDAAEDIVQDYFSRGQGSKHPFGESFDVRTFETRNGIWQEKPTSIIQQMISSAKNLGFSPFLESDHLHISVAAGNGKKNILLIGLLLGGLLLISKKS